MMKIIFTSLIIFTLFRPSVSPATGNPGEIENLGTYRTPDQKSGEYQRPLTDEERVKALDFQHAGLIQRTMEAECAKSKERMAACSGKRSAVFGESQDKIVQVVSQMFSLFMGQVGGGKIKSGKKPKKKGGGQSDKKKSDEKEVPCGHIPPGTTLVAQAMQSAGQDAIGSRLDQKVAQKEVLYKQSRTHRVRVRAATVETIGWGGTASCYIAFSASPFGLHVDKGTYLKIGAAAFLSFFYNRQRTQHKKYANIVKDIANALPGSGDCNPITERDCYCAQAETADDPQYCFPANNRSNGLPPGTVAVSCVDAQLQFDPSCNCASSGTCADQTFRPLFTLPGFSAQTTAGQSLRHVRELVNGQFNSAQLGNSALGQGAFKKALRLMDQNIPVENQPLTKSQKKTARILIRSGIPKRLAAQLAKAPLTSKGRALMARFKRRIIPDMKTAVGHLSMKDPFRKKSTRKRKQEFPSHLFKKQGRNKYKNEVIQFAKRAESKASISKDRNKSVFETISYRYQNTGWEKLEFNTP